MTVPRDRTARAASVLDRLAALRRSGVAPAQPIADAAGVIDQDHPLVRVVGADRATELLDGSIDPRILALDRRNVVEEMSRDGRTVRDIAAATGLSERHVVFLRRDLGVGRRR